MGTEITLDDSKPWEKEKIVLEVTALQIIKWDRPRCQAEKSTKDHDTAGQQDSKDLWILK